MLDSSPERGHADFGDGLRVATFEGGPTAAPAVHGTLIAGVIAAVTLFFLFVNPDYRPGVYGVALWIALSLAYFGFYARHQIILSPEEEFAMRVQRGG